MEIFDEHMVLEVITATYMLMFNIEIKTTRDS